MVGIGGGVVSSGLFGCFYYGFAGFLVGFVLFCFFVFWVFGSGGILVGRGQWWHGGHGGGVVGSGLFGCFCYGFTGSLMGFV